MSKVGSGTTAYSAEQLDGVGLALLLRRSEQAMRDSMETALGDEDLLWEHWQILALLQVHPGLRMSEIAEAAVLPAATLTRHMDRLVERALVVRRIDPEDKRRVVAALSPMGAQVTARLRAVELGAEDALVEALGPERYAVLRRELALVPTTLG